MNCANHSDQAAVAFCRTCGKPLCNQCNRDVRGVIYCESCLAARLEGAPAPGTYTPPPPPPPPNVYPPIGGPSGMCPEHRLYRPGQIRLWPGFSPVSFPSV